MRRPTTHLLLVGILVVILAVVWWWVTYREVIEYAYLSTREAGLCLVGRSAICDLARALCRGAHPVALVNYWWGTFWIGVVIASASLLLHSRRQT